MENEMPEIIKEVGFDFRWDNKKVWALDVPTSSMNIKDLLWHFDYPFHWDLGEKYTLTSRQILENSEKYKAEYERTLNADLKHPIDVMFYKGRWLIIDGLHRLMKAHILGMNEVQVRKIPEERISDIKV